MSERNKEMLREYALLTAQEKEIEHKKKILKVEIITHMEAQELELLDTSLGKFTIASRRVYTKYPDAVEQALLDIEAAKKTAEAEGHAEYTDTEYLKFTATK